MRLLLLGTDELVFREGSATRERLRSYGRVFDELHVVVFTRRAARHEPAQLAPNVRVYPTNSRFRALYLFDYLSAVRRHVAPGGVLAADVVSAQDPAEIGIIAWLIARWYRVGLHLQVHTDIFSPRYGRQGARFRLHQLLARLLLPRADGVRVVSERVHASVLRVAPAVRDRVHVLPIFVDVARLEAMPPTLDLHKRYPQFSTVLLSAGRLTKEKNLTFLLEVFAEVAHTVPNVGLVMVGSGPERARLEARARSLGVGAQVMFEPWQEDLTSHLKSADLFLLTSSYEGYGRTLVEAAAANLPFVSSDVGVAAALFPEQHARCVCPVGDHACFVEKITRLASSITACVSCAEGLRHDLLAGLPRDAAAYARAYRDDVGRARRPKSSRLLVCTQKVDRDDPVLGFFHAWVAVFAERWEHIHVVCLEEGAHDLPENVSVTSLGKVRGSRTGLVQRVRYALRLYRSLFRLRGAYDSVFVHMNPEYVLLGGLLWRFTGKRVFFWYNHERASVTLYVSRALVRGVLHTSPYAAPARFGNALRMPAGIDATRFHPDVPPRDRGSTILYLGRIAPIKGLHTLFAAVRKLDERDVGCTLSVYGDALPQDASYRGELERSYGDLIASGRITLYGGIRNEAAPEVYCAHALFVNASPSGLYDKTVLEAMASGCLPLASSKAFGDVLPETLRFREGDAGELSRKLAAALALPERERRRLAEKLRLYVEREHALERLALELRTLYEHT